jgi:signal transduction histidine kinase
MGFGGRKRNLGEPNRATEDALIPETAQLVSICDNLDVGIYVSDPRTYEILYANRFTKDLFQKDLIGGICYQEFRDLDSPCESCSNEIILKQKPVPYFWEHHDPIHNKFFSIIDRIIEWPDGRDVRLEVAIDVTEEEKLRVSVAQADRLASMGLLAAGVAHEINNPLTHVFLNLWSIQEALSGLSGTANAKGEVSLHLDDINALNERLKNTLNGSEIVRDIVKDIKAFSRIDESNVLPVSLNSAIGTAVSMAQNEIKYRARLVKEFGDIPLVNANDGRLAQVFLNLLLNAAHAIDEGDTENNEIRIRTWSEGKEVFAEISDTGKGIPPESLERLFDPFYTTKPIGVGSGLGLSICHKIITSYDGKIEVESNVGDGTSFVVRLPAKSKKELQNEVLEPTEGESENSAMHGRILLVDDNPALRKTLRRLLESEHDVVTAASGREAQQILESDTDFDVILCDLMMSEGTGMDLYEWLENKNPDLTNTVVFMTGGLFTHKAKEFLNSIPNLSLEKPFAKGSIETTLKKLIAANKKEK